MTPDCTESPMLSYHSEYAIHVHKRLISQPTFERMRIWQRIVSMCPAPVPVFFAKGGVSYPIPFIHRPAKSCVAVIKASRVPPSFSAPEPADPASGVYNPSQSSTRPSAHSPTRHRTVSSVPHHTTPHHTTSLPPTHPLTHSPTNSPPSAPARFTMMPIKTR